MIMTIIQSDKKTGETNRILGLDSMVDVHFWSLLLHVVNIWKVCLLTTVPHNTPLCVCYQKCLPESLQKHGSVLFLAWILPFHQSHTKLAHRRTSTLNLCLPYISKNLGLYFISTTCAFHLCFDCFLSFLWF